MRKISVLLVALSVPVIVNGVAPACSQTIVGFGIQSCGRYLEARRDRDKTADASNRTLAFTQWLAGFLTVVNLETTKKNGIDIIEGTDLDGVMGWLDKYCRENPLDSFDRASWNLAAELRKRKTPKEQ